MTQIFPGLANPSTFTGGVRKRATIRASDVSSDASSSVARGARVLGATWPAVRHLAFANDQRGVSAAAAALVRALQSSV
jgi:hypothetical protein